jgi:hypothetical protein
MNTEHIINDRIQQKTIQIRESYPELSIFLDEMNVYSNDFSPNSEIVNDSILIAYYKSLEALLISYGSMKYSH